MSTVTETPEGFLCVPITPEMVEEASAHGKKIGLLRNSIRDGKGNLVGCLGELVARVALGAISDNDFQHDLKLGDTLLEVKTKDRTVRPRLSYEASVAEYNTKQNADVYVFVSITRNSEGDYTTGYVVGLMEKKEYLKKARPLKKGDIDPSNYWIVSADCHNLPYEDLARFTGWLEEHKDEAS